MYLSVCTAETSCAHLLFVLSCYLLIKIHVQVNESDALGGEWEGEVEEGEVDEDEKLSAMCWNVCVWSQKGGICGNRMKNGHDMRAEVIGFYRPDAAHVSYVHR